MEALDTIQPRSNSWLGVSFGFGSSDGRMEARCVTAVPQESLLDLVERLGVDTVGGRSHWTNVLADWISLGP